MALDALIFDIDGTLVDSNAAHVVAWERAFARQGYRIPADRIAIETGKGGDHLVPAILGQQAERSDGAALRAAQKEEFLREARGRRFACFPGATRIFSELSRRGIRTALATSSSGEHLAALERSSGLDVRHLADVLITKDDAAESKPAPDLIEAAVRKLGLEAAQCAMVGDTVYDAEAAALAGVVCLGVSTGGNDAGVLRRAGMRQSWRDIGALLDDLDRALRVASPGSVHLDRPTLEMLMREALAAARAGLDSGEVPIGAVLAGGDGRIRGCGFNEMRRSGVLTAHAEMVAFARAGAAIAPDARDVLLVSTLEPCVMCTGAAMETAVDTIVYGLVAPPDAGTRRVRPPESADNGVPRIVGGVLAAESRALLERWITTNPNPEQQPYVEQLLASTQAAPARRPALY